jgi:hypothetical protein
MTTEEMLNALALEEWKAVIKEVFKSDVFKKWRQAYEKYHQEQMAAEKQSEKVEKVVERLAEERRLAKEQQKAEMIAKMGEDKRNQPQQPAVNTAPNQCPWSSEDYKMFRHECSGVGGWIGI